MKVNYKCHIVKHRVPVGYAEYMVFPRISAIAEVVWTPKELRNPDNFIMRMEKQFRRYDILMVNYRQK